MKDKMMEVERKVKVKRKKRDLVVTISGNTPTLRCKDSFEAKWINLKENTITAPLAEI